MGKMLLLEVSCSKQLSTVIVNLKEEMSLIKHGLRKLNNYMSKVEERVSKMENHIIPFKRHLKKIVKNVSLLINKWDDQENRLCGNIRHTSQLLENAKSYSAH